MAYSNEPRLHVIIYSRFPRCAGGRENWVFNILRHFNQRGHCVSVYAYRSSLPSFYNLESLEHVELITVPTIRYWHRAFSAVNLVTLRCLFLADSLLLFPFLVARALKRHLQANDVVLAMNPVVDIRPALRVRHTGSKFRLLCSVRGLVALELSNKIPWLTPLFYRLEEETLQQADVVLANGYDTQSYLESAGVESQVIPNGVDILRFNNPDLDDPALNPVRSWRSAGRRIIMMVATLRPIKGIEDLLQGARILKRLSPPAFGLVFVGKGNRRYYRGVASELGLAGETIFVGEQSNVPGFLSYADVVACLSGGGGMSMALLEGMAAGRAVVAWDTPVYQQLIESSRSGILVPLGDHKKLALAIKEVLESSELATRLGCAARETAAEYDWSIVADKLSAACMMRGR